MAGCYGGHPVDQYYEAMLFDYLREDERPIDDEEEEIIPYEPEEYEPYSEMPDSEKADPQKQEIEIPF
jgi:hypothetical protein